MMSLKDKKINSQRKNPAPLKDEFFFSAGDLCDMETLYLSPGRTLAFTRT